MEDEEEEDRGFLIFWWKRCWCWCWGDDLGVVVGFGFVGGGGGGGPRMF